MSNIGSGNYSSVSACHDFSSGAVRCGEGSDPTERTIKGTDGNDVLTIKKADGIAGQHGLYEVNLNGDVTMMTKEELENTKFDLGKGDDAVVAAGADADLTINTGAGDDLVIGGNGDDTLKTGSGDDIVLGMGGDDTIKTGSGDDLVLGFGGGDDSVNTGSGDDRVSGGLQNLQRPQEPDDGFIHGGPYIDNGGDLDNNNCHGRDDCNRPSPIIDPGYNINPVDDGNDNCPPESDSCREVAGPFAGHGGSVNIDNSVNNSNNNSNNTTTTINNTTVNTTQPEEGRSTLDKILDPIGLFD
jgi:hypothetical protein